MIREFIPKIQVVMYDGTNGAEIAALTQGMCQVVSEVDGHLELFCSSANEWTVHMDIGDGWQPYGNQISAAQLADAYVPVDSVINPEPVINSEESPSSVV